MRDGNTVICTDCFRNKALYWTGAGLTLTFTETVPELVG
jgi:hypothetical protein